MAQDLTIRLLGRPKVTKDSQLGFQRLARKYVVQGPRASKAGIEDPNNPLFLEVGTADEEFTDHYLVNQQIDPSSSMDRAALTRDFVQIRDTFNAESVSESGDLKKLQRKYTVLRSQHEKGYSALSWAEHPHNSNIPANDPWDYLPEVIKGSEPGVLSYDVFGNVSNTPAGLKQPMVALNGVSIAGSVSIHSEPHVPLADALSHARASSDLTSSWVRATATVDTSNPGVDIWSVSWVAPVTDYWTSQEGKKSNPGSSAPPSIFDFDENGVKVLRLGKSAKGGTSQVVYKSYISFVVGEDPGVELSSFFNGSGATLGPAVSMDFHFVGVDGNHRIASFRQALPNTWKTIDTTDGLKFPSSGTGIEEGNPKPDGSGNYSLADEIADGAGIKIAEGTAKSYIFNYTHQKDEPYPMYQGQPIMKTGGRMDWTHYYDNSSNYSSTGGSSIAPIFSHGNIRIWKIKTVFIS
jgi:hypothetical protein